MEFLILSTNRMTLLFGKTISILLILLISQFYSMLAFLSIFITYDIPIPSIEKLINAMLVGFLIGLVPFSFSLFSNCLTLRLNTSSHTAAYITIFIFFVIPSIIYFSLFQIGVFQEGMLDYSIHTYTQAIISYLVNPNSIITTSFFNESVSRLGIISLSLLLASVLLFQTTPIYWGTQNVNTWYR